MVIRAAALSGTPATAAQIHPFITPSLPSMPGVLLGREMRTNERVMFDPYAWKREGLIHSTTFGFFGEKNAGKSAILKALTLRLSALQAPTEDGRIERMRIRIHDRKHEGSEGEYSRLTQLLGSKIVKPSQMRINLFDPAMNMGELDILHAATNLFEEVTGRQLQGFEPLSLQVGVHKMCRRFPAMTSPGLLRDLLFNLGSSDLDDYFLDSHNELLDRFQDSILKDAELAAELEVQPQRPQNVPEQLFRDDAARVAVAMGEIVRGKYGDLFSGSGSLREALSQRVLTIDWTGTNEESRTLLEAMLHKWQTVAIANHDMDMIPHVLVGEEEHHALKSLMYVRFRSESIKIARSIHTIDMYASQYRTDFAVGEPNSELRNKAMGILAGTACKFYGKHPDEDWVTRELAGADIGNYDIEQIKRLRPKTGSFGIKFSDEKGIIYVQAKLTPTELAIIPTDSASENMLDRRQEVTSDPNVLRRLSAMNGNGAMSERVRS